jgi:hypothetical protein
MEAMNAVASPMNLISVQIGAMPTDGTQASQGAGEDGSPFMAVLQTILGAADGRTDQTQLSGKESTCREIQTVLMDLFSSPSAAASLNQLKAGQTGQVQESPITAIIRQLEQTSQGQTDPKGLVEQLSSLMGMATKLAINEGSVDGTEGNVESTDTKNGVPTRGVEEAVLRAFTRLFEQRNSGRVTNDVDDDEGEKEIPGEEDSEDQNESIEAIAAEIASLLLLADNQARTTEIRALPQSGASIVQNGEVPEGLSEERSENTIEPPSQKNAAMPGSTVGDMSLPEETAALDSDEEAIGQTTTDHTPSAQTAIDTAATSAIHAAFIIPQHLNKGATNDLEKSTKETISPQNSACENPIQPMGKRGEVLTQFRSSTATNVGANDGIAQAHEYVDKHGLTQQSASATQGRPTGDPSTGQNVSAERTLGQGVESAPRAKIVYSRFHEPGTSDEQMAAQAQRTIAEGSNEPAAKVSSEIRSISGRGDEIDVVRPGPSSKSQSFTKGEGDSQQLSQGLGGQRIAERSAINDGGTSSFGDIVAERIARTVEHVAQTNRSDLTLRLRIDGSESVILEMKERAGTIVIGIQCQDKSMAKALENQIDIMVRNLEAKQVSTSISISSVGEDGQDGQRQWQRERHEQQRHNWNERRTSSHSYFETLI